MVGRLLAQELLDAFLEHHDDEQVRERLRLVIERTTEGQLDGAGRKYGPLYLGPHAINKWHDVYRESTRYLTASDLTKAVNGFLAASHGVLLRDNGSVYFLTGEFIEEYETLARELVGPKLHCWQVDLTANDKLLATLHDNVQESLISRMEQRAGEWEELTARGGKARADGLQSRFDARVEDARQIEYYEEFLQVRLDRLRGALERQ